MIANCKLQNFISLTHRKCTEIMNKRKLILAVILISLIFSSCLKNYYGVNGFGKFSFVDSNRFYYDYYDLGNDTGYYQMRGDTIFLTSSIQSVEFHQCNSNNLTDTSNSLDIRLRIFEKNEESFKDTILKMNQLNRIYINNQFFYSGQLLSFNFFVENRFLVRKNLVFNGYFEIDSIIGSGKCIYFQNYPLLIKDGYLLPFDKDANTYFKKINDSEFLPMKKGRKDKKYKTNYSGFGHIR